ncbi:restriction endonuclease subunit S [Rhizobium leguminosarum]|uniref:restriction endonuclease subunit S n=1 Tax=Rhizobium leguminosarum TaxID=384 RepID=UPI0010309B02|nr:restriction endonuclease subunit S [Rhizobium leguminosarum]TBG44614.1 restriction endonuclease subunit S [Rhizobium leguminosarum]
MTDWQSKPLGHVIELQRGYDLTEAERGHGDIPVIGSAGQNGWHNKAKAKGPGVTVGRSGASIGVVTLTQREYWPHNTVLFVKDFKGNDPAFIANLLRCLNLAALNSGSAQPSLNRNFVYPIEVRIPPPQKQRRIASILSAYDDLIENNRRRVAILEEIAQRLFNEWFVRPVGERLPIPGDRIEEWILPSGWRFSSLSKIANIIMGQSPSSSDYSAKDEGLPFHQGVTDFEGRFHQNRLFLRSDLPWKRTAKKGDVLFSVRAPVGRIAVALEALALGRGLCAIRELAGDQVFLLTHLLVSFPSSDMFGGGTIYKAVTKDDVHSIPILQPPEDLKKRFETLASPMWEQLRTLTNANMRLQTARDLLLPKLILGEMEVSTAEETFAEAAE